MVVVSPALSVLPLSVGTCPPGRYYPTVGFEGAPEYATWNWNKARESRERRRGEREREVSKGVADPLGTPLDGPPPAVWQRCRAVTLNPLGRSTG